MRAPSPETKIRYLRCLLRNASEALIAQHNPLKDERSKRDLAQYVVTMIERELRPKRRARASGGGER